MEVFNKIYSHVSSSVSSTVSQLSSVLPGNPVTREFDATSHIASGGPGLLWKIYKGTKRSTKQEASIFVFEKRQLEKYNKTDRDIILESLKRGITQLTKIRHPQILIVQHPLEESRESLAFATEPVFASLANILGQTLNMPQPTNLNDYKLYDIEIKYGLLQIGEGLAFLHNDVKLLHKNICPETIIINQQGAWKIFGFDFCVMNTSLPNSPPFYPFIEYSPTLPSIAQPCLSYTAPEIISAQSHSTSSDIFSLGMLIYTLHSRSEDSFQCVKSLQQFKSRLQMLHNLSMSKLQNIPEDLREYAKLMMNVTPDLRPDAHQFIKVPYFEDVGVKTLNYLDSLLQWDNLQRSQFFKGLPEALKKLPHRVQVQRVLPCLIRDLTQPAMVPFVLPSIFDIAQDCTQKEYVQCILPGLKPVMALIEPIQILLLMLQRMELLLKLTPSTDIQQHVLPMLYRGLDSNAPQVHELCLSVLPTFAGLLDHSNVKNSLLPRIKKLCLSTSSLSVRVNCLLCIGRLLEHLDKWLVLDEVVPFLPQIPSREPAVLMGILGIYKLALNHKKLGISKEVIATRILPFLIPLCIENGLTLSQFNSLVALVKQMFQMVESEHRTKLEQLNNVQQQQKALEASMPSFTTTSPTPKHETELDQVFGGLGLESFEKNQINQTNKSNSLSLEEKQRLSKQQETVKSFQKQIPLEPISNRNFESKQNQIKDLSATLLEKNLTNFNNSMNKPQNIPQPQPMIGFNMNNSFQWSSTTSSTSLQANPLTPFGGQNTNTNFSKYKNDGSPNWGALDSLLPQQSGKLPMNQMPSSQPLLKPSNSFNKLNNNQNVEKLSKDDIMDLLS
ncbi:SCY1-like protein 2 [Onthophagus taurus]|uniref:SCY1-like protein 2 n=1 Tax=Onthophagus taurus TaxID=166361 RepID=UPI0039BE0EFE